MIKANFNAYNSYVTDSLYQWDKDQTLRVSGVNIAVAPEIHFTNIEMDRAIVRQGELKDGIISVKIPNSLLQSIQDIKVYIGVWEGSTFTTIETVVIPVIMRDKPEDYVLEVNDEEYYSFSRLENEIANMVTLAGFNAQVAKTEAEIKTKEEALKAQIANIIAHNNDTEGNTELLDIRTGADGTVYPSAGDAVRGQVSDLKGDLSDETNRATERENEIEKLFTMPTKEAVNTWLDEHPEATTTVQDHSLSIEKMVVGTLGYVTPEMFGAKGDGVTDDTQAFIECVKSNRVIKIDKSYKIGSITFAEKLCNVQFVGYGGSINGSMSFNDVENFNFDKVDFVSTFKGSILSFSKVNGLVVSNCLFSNSDSEWGDANSSLIYVNNGTENAIKHITIKDSRFTTNYSVNQNNNFKCAIKIFNSNTDLFYSNFINITGNTFFDSAFIGVECRTLSDVIISNNIFDDIKNTNTYGNPLVSCASTYNTTISDNIFNKLNCGIEITGNDFSVLGNVFKNKVGTDGWIITTGEIDRAIIDNNIFNYGKISLGINDVETNDIVFSNNKSKGFAIEIGGTGVKGLVIRDNVMTGSDFHLYAVNYTVSNVTIMNNIFSSDIGTSSLIRFNSNQKINELTIYNNVTDGKQFTNNEVLNDMVKTISGCGTNVGGFSNDTYMFSSSNITEFSIKVPSNLYKGLHKTLASIKASMYNNNSVPYYGEWNMSFGSYDTAQTPALSKIDGTLPDLSVKSCVLSDDEYIITLGFAEELSSSVDIYFEFITFSNDTKGGILSVNKVS